MATTPGAVNRIAYVDADGQLCSIAPDGGEQRVLANDGRFCQFPAWSPDSNLIAVISSDRRSSGITITSDAPGQIQAQYASEDGPPIYLYWSPDPRYLSFLAATGETLALILLEVGGERQFCAYGQPCFWHFSPDGRMVLTHSGGAGNNGRLRLLTTDGIEQGERLPNPGHFQAPAISHEGDFLAFATLDQANHTRLVVARPSGETLAGLDYNGVLALAWSSREPLLAFTHPYEQAMASYGPLQLLDATNGAVRLLVSDDVIAFFWSPDGSAIAFFTLARAPSYSTRQYGAFSRVGESANEPRAASALTLSLGVVDVLTAQIQRLARFAPQPLFVNQFLPFFDQYAHSHRIWSPDSQAIVLPVTARNGTGQIAIVPRDGSRASIIADGAMAFWSTR